MSEAYQVSAGNAANVDSSTHNLEEGHTALRDRKDSSGPRPPNIFQRSRSRGRTEEKRPNTAGRFSRSKSRNRRSDDEPKRQLSRKMSRRRTRSTSEFNEATKDLSSLSPPQLTRLDCMNVHSDASTIGMAVGSPSQFQATNTGPLGPSALASTATSILNSGDHHLEDAGKPAKGSRWKKIGGIFKTKNAFANEQPPSPFYQLQARYATQMVNQSASTAGPAPGEQDGRFLFDKLLGSDGQLDLQKGSTQRPQKTSFPAGLPLLDVKIPDVQMERYSVMFGKVLDRSDSPSLLSRRDKALGKLVAISDFVEEPSELADMQEEHRETSETRSNDKDRSNLAPHSQNAYPRRATSPTPSKTPSFSLFPQLPEAPGKIVGPIPGGKQSPLQRSFTSPARMSPMQEAFNRDEVQDPKPAGVRVHDKAITSPPHTASTSDLKSVFSNHSVRSPTSTCSSVHEDLLLEMKTLGSLRISQDRSEAMNNQELKVAPLKPRHASTDSHWGNSSNQKVDFGGSRVNRNDVHEDTLAALERPAPPEAKSRDIVSLKPSKARIDQIMRGAQPKDPSTAIAQDRGRQGLLGVSQSKALNETPENNANTSTPPTSAGEIAELGAQSETLSMGKKIPSSISLKQETASLPKDAHPKRKLTPQPIQQIKPIPQDLSDDFSRRQAQNATPSSSKEFQPATLFNSIHNSTSETGKRRAGQAINVQNMSRHFPGKTHHDAYPKMNASPSIRPPLAASSQSYPKYRPPPQGFTEIQPRFNQMNPPSRSGTPTVTIPPAEKDQDNILDYYLEDAGSKPSPQPPKVRKKLQKRPSHKSKKRLSFHPKSPPLPKAEPKPSLSLSGGPRSPVPTSKYSANATATHRPYISPPVNLDTQPGHHHSGSHSSAYSVHSQYSLETAVESQPTPTAVERPPPSRGRSITIPSLDPPRRPPRADMSFIVDAQETTSTTTGNSLNETSFYRHSNVSTPSLNLRHRRTSSRTQTPNENFPSQQQPQTKPPVPRRSPSRGNSLNSLPVGAGGVVVIEPQPIKTNASTMRPAHQLFRSASAATVSGIHGHLKPEKGEKVVEMEKGLMPKIVDPENDRERGGLGHRAGRSVNLVIESV